MTKTQLYALIGVPTSPRYAAMGTADTSIKGVANKTYTGHGSMSTVTAVINKLKWDNGVAPMPVCDSASSNAYRVVLNLLDSQELIGILVGNDISGDVNRPATITYMSLDTLQGVELTLSSLALSAAAP